MLKGNSGKKQDNKDNSKGERLGSDLKAALNNRLTSTGKIHHLALSDIKPNPANKRKLAIPLDEFLAALRVGSDDSMVYIEDDQLVFPELTELNDLEIDLDIRTVKQQIFYSKIRELALSIFNQGELINPVEVSPIENGYMLGPGHRRWFASHFVPQKTKIEAFIKPKDHFSPLKASIRRWDENDKRHDNSLLEKIDHVEEVMELLKQENPDKKVKQVDIASQLSLKKHEASYFVNIIKADLLDTERAILEDNQLDDLRTVADICRVEDSSVRYKAFLTYQEKGNTAARTFVTNHLESLKENTEEKPVPAQPKPKKIAPSQVGVTKLVDVLKAKAPYLVDSVDPEADPADILLAILERLEEDSE